MKIYVHTKISTWLFITALFIIAKNCRQPECPSVDEYFNVVYLYNVGYSLNKKEWTIESYSNMNKYLEMLF